MFNALLLATTVFTHAAPAADIHCAMSYSAVHDRHVAAIQNRDIENYMSTISPEGLLMVLPDGSSWDTVEAIEAGHRQWFADDTWTFVTEPVRESVTEAYGLVIYRVEVQRPDQESTPFLLSMLFAPDDSGCWYLVHDQNTILPTTD